MSKKILAMLMAVAMAFSLLPVTAFATGETQEGNSQTPVTVKKSENNLAMTKTVTPKGDGTYTVSLESYATGSVTTTQAAVPMDFVLVLDVSGSMDGENGQIASYGYQKTKKTSWYAENVYYAITTYYAKIGEEYYPVSCQRERVPNEYIGSHYEYWLEANGEQLGNKGKWGEQLYSESLYIYGEVPGSRMSKLAAMKTAVNNFIESVAAQKNGETPVAHRISIVKFAGDSKNEVGNHTYNDGSYNYTQKVTELTDVTTNGSVASLKTAVNALTAGGATRADLGMEKADGVLNGRQDAEKDRPSVVIMFTDGEPTKNTNFNWNVAGAAVDTAKTLKDKNTKVYTIGMFTDADPSDTRGAFNKYMNGVSSKYPGAVGTKHGNDYYGITLGDPADGNYYFKADNAGNLDQVFQKISQSTTTTSTLDASAVVVDNVPSNFALTEGSVKVYTADCTGKTGEELNWGTATPAQGISSTSTKNDDGSQTISTTGFNFSRNWCGLDSKNKPTGQKLIIEFTIKCTNYGGTQPTNAGAYIKAKEADEKPIISLKDPTVPVTISLGSKENSLKNPEVKDEKTYDGTGLAILPKIAEKANALATGTDNAYVNMDLTVTVGKTTYTYKIPAGKTTGSWYQGDSADPMTPKQIAAVTTPKDVNRENNEIKPYTYDFNLKLSDKTEGGAKEANYGPYSASFTINPARVTVTANDQQVEKGTAPASITYTDTVTGLVNGEAESLISRTIQCEGYTVDTPVGSDLQITATGDKEQGNYTVTYRPGKLTVTEAPVTTGTLKVTKEVQGDDLTLKSLPSDFKITVTGPNSYNRSFPLPETVGDSDKTVTWTISALPAGEYTVSETNADVKGYDCTATYSATNGATVIVNRDASAVQNQPATDAQTVTVAADSTSTMTVTNKYTKQQEVVPTPDTSKPDVNKTATDLVNDKTDVTLSVGGKSAKENVAVMFLLDKSTSQGVRDEAAKMLDELATKTNTNIMYDVVIFSGTASSSGWQDIQDSTTLDAIKDNFVGSNPTDGTNMSAGILKAKSDIASLKNTHKEYTETYLITLSDGITYVWSEVDQGKVYCIPVSATGNSDSESSTQNAVDTWDMMYDYGKSLEEVYGGVPQFLSAIQSKITQTKNDSHVQEYPSLQNPIDTYIYDAEKTKETTDKYACGPEAAMYYSITGYEQLAKEFTKTFAYALPELNKKTGEDNVTNWTSFPWGREVMEYCKSISFNKTWDGNVSNTNPGKIFSGIKDVIYYEIQSGSITDVIGADFSLTDQTLTQNTFTLTVNGKAVTANAPSGNVITFGEKDTSTDQYPYVLTYYKGKAAKNEDNTYTITSGSTTYTYTPCDTTGEVNGSLSDEFFVLEMNVPVVSLDLKYNLSLTSKRTAAGTYEVPTNESATLAYTSANQSGGTVDFNEPTVSYTVKSSSGSHSGGSRPSLNTKDHYGYIIGYPVDYYTGQPTTDQTKKPVRPEGKITRAEVATIYFRMLTDESRTKFWSQSNSYSDVKTGDWFNNAVSTLSNAGIIAGYEDGSFRPNGYITRAEFATIAARFFDVTYNGKDLFPDISGHWAKDYINQAANKGFVNGYEDGTFKPDRNITRAEAVTLVNRTLDRHPDKNHFTKDMLVWPDNMDQTKWYYADMQEATNSHTYQMKENSDKTKYENWTKTLPIRNWEALEKAWSNANSSQGNGNVV